MKKIAIIYGVLALTACIRAGGNNFLPSRNQWIEDLQTYPITYYDNTMKQVKSELLTERNFPENRVLSSAVGYSVVDDKTYRKLYYAREVLRATMDGGLATAISPVMYKKAQQVEMIGEVFIDGTRYAIIPAEEKGFVVLVDGNGRPYHRLGQIRNDRVALLVSDFFVSPENFGFEPVMLTKTEQTTPIKGFDIKYGGLKSGYVTFIYYDFDVPSNDGLHDSGEFEVLSFPKKEKLVNLKGIKLKIIEARKESLDYMILEK